MASNTASKRALNESVLAHIIAKGAPPLFLKCLPSHHLSYHSPDIGNVGAKTPTIANRISSTVWGLALRGLSATIPRITAGKSNSDMTITVEKIPVFAPDLGVDTVKHVVDAFDVGWLGMGAITKEFKDRISAFLGLEGRYFVATNTRTSALHISNHTHEHVLAGLTLYSKSVSAASYLVVLDKIIEHMPESFSAERPRGSDNNPATAVREFLAATDRFVLAWELEDKLLVMECPGGYLKCVKDEM